MQYAQGGHSPKNDPVQDAELRYQIRRLSSHASIVLWDGCNECRVIIGTATGIYATFVMTVVAEEDASRSIWPSCPALGWTGGVDKLTARPNGESDFKRDFSCTVWSRFGLIFGVIWHRQAADHAQGRLPAGDTRSVPARQWLACR